MTAKMRIANTDDERCVNLLLYYYGKSFDIGEIRRNENQ